MANLLGLADGFVGLSVLLVVWGGVWCFLGILALCGVGVICYFDKFWICGGYCFVLYLVGLLSVRVGLGFGVCVLYLCGLGGFGFGGLGGLVWFSVRLLISVVLVRG